MALTILEGSTFCICDERGDLSAATHGLYASDTRFLSRFTLTLNGAAPLLLTSGKVEYFSAAFYLRNPISGGLEQDQVAITRERFVGDGMQERIVLQTLAGHEIVVDVALETGNDFADIFAVKHHDFALGDPTKAEPLPPLAPPDANTAAGQIVLADTTSAATTQLVFSNLGDVEEGTVRWHIALGPHERWEVRVDLVVSLDGERIAPAGAGRRLRGERAPP